MSIDTTANPTCNDAPAAARPASLPRTAVVAGLVAAAVTTAAAAAVHAAGVSFEVRDEMIPLSGFAFMTFVGAVIGGVLLAGLARWTRSARRRFLQVAVVLTLLSCIPSIAWPDVSATKVALVALHVLAAVIVVPVLARHAGD